MKKTFEEIFEIMNEAFPDNEMRTYQGQKMLLDHNLYYIEKKIDENGMILGFLAAWELPLCNFVEHIAIKKEARGQGIGKSLLLDYIKKCSDNRPIFLEVEMPETEIAKRRIGFYERLGFKLNNFEYFQLPLRKDQEKKPLFIMSYPEAIDEKSFEIYKKEIYNTVYKVGAHF